MKRTFGTITLLALSWFMLLGTAIPISADNYEISADSTTLFMSHNFDELQSKNEEIIRLEYEDKNITTFGGSTNWDYHSTNIDSQVGGEVYMGAANGQSTGGTNFGPFGGSFGYTDSQSGKLKSVSLSFKVYGIMSVGIGLGSATTNGVGTYNFNAPANRAVKLYIYKTMMATKWNNYRTHRTTGVTEYLGSNYTFSVYSVRGDVR